MEAPEQLAKRQQVHWDPLVDWFASRFGAAPEVRSNLRGCGECVQVTTGLVTPPPPAVALEGVKEYIEVPAAVRALTARRGCVSGSSLRFICAQRALSR